MRVSPELSDLLTFTTSFGKVSYLVLPYGIKFATDAFQFGVENHFYEFLHKAMSIYVDNMLVYANTRRQHAKDLKDIFQRCGDGNLKLRLEKCVFGVEELRTLGFIVRKGSITVDPIKLQILKNAPIPTTPKELKSFLGLANYFRAYLPYLAHAAAPLYNLTHRSDDDFHWTDVEDRAYEKVKKLLERELMLHAFDETKDIHVYVDASKVAIAGVILQEGKLISSVSRTLSKPERKWHIIELEALAVRYTLQKLRHFLHGRKFLCFTDHKPLLQIWKKAAKIENVRLLTSVLSVTEYDFELLHIPGEENVLADYGSRNIDPDIYPTDDELQDIEDWVGNMIASFVRPEEELPAITMEDYTHVDFDELQERGFNETEDNGALHVTVNRKTYIYVPSKMRQSFFHVFHAGRHRGVNEMVLETKEAGYYFPGMKDTYLAFLSTCPCAGAKDFRTALRRTKGKGITALRPMDLVALDTYFYDQKYYLLMVDIFSKFPFVYALKNKTMEEVGAAFNHWRSMFGTPSSLLVDNGGEFNSITDIPKQFTPIHHPQSNGAVERLNREL
ncbi:unnamed protein product, partial [Heterosigma akashiwo]